MTELSLTLERYQTRTDDFLRAHLATLTAVPQLTQAMSYSLFAGGKRVRPALVLAACEAVGASLDHALPYAAALEMIHTYSLIHDDLPAMDDDTLRRGRPTNHIRFDEATAILAGDALLTQAFVLLSAPSWNLDPAQKLKLTELLATAAGSQGMVGGQLLDLLFEGQSCTLSQLETIHRLKTGALLHAAVLGGALAGGADANTLARFDRYGQRMGLAFQIADDVLDVTASSQTLGKDAGSDLKHGKSTYVSLMGLEASRQKAQDLLAQALAELAPLGPKAQTLRDLATYIVHRSH